jgi:hypothetical protein
VKPVLRRIKPLIFLLLILTPTIVTLSSLYGVKAEVSIISVIPFSGYVGDTVWVTANITTESGSYEIFFDQESVCNGSAVGRLVNASFLVPHAVKGVHNITVKVETGEASAEFTVLTRYSIRTDAPKFPNQLQENGTINIFLNVTGGQADATYTANMTVINPTNAAYGINASLASTTDLGNYIATIEYPSTQWSPSDANTNYTGTYTISWLNGTEVQESETFFVGLTNSSRYHRGDSVDIKAVDYLPNQEVNITISGVGTSFFERFINTTDADGVVNASWTVPQNATIGNYTLSITYPNGTVPGSKQTVNDTQIFEIPGFKTEIFTRNLANHTVSNVFVRAYDNSTSIYYNATSGVNGSAIVMLERGFHSCEAFFKKVRVYEENLTIENETQVDFTCQLTSANINVIDAQDVRVPFVFVNLTYNYTTNLDAKENRTETDSGETNITGTLQLHSLLPNVTYTINASRYEKVFNTNNNTIYDLPAEAYENITILCPTKKLQVHVIDTNDQSIVNAIVKAQELMGGLNYDNVTDISGTAVLECTFGKYVVRVYQGEITLNETTLDLFEDQNETIKCQLYGLTVAIKVVDFFGQPISNANVTLQREGLAPRSALTETDGKATFDSLIGGSLQIAVYLGDQAQSCVTRNFFIDSSTTIEIKIEKYVLLVGLLVETSQLTTVIIILVTVILVLLVEVYRRMRLKPEKGSS